jgi:uncharacterized protein (DUF4415 family)
VSAKRTRGHSRVAERPLRGRADLARLRRASVRQIAETSPPELAGLPVDFWGEAKLAFPVGREAISLRVDRDILAWFRAQGPRYQSRMNAVLRTYVVYVRKHGRKRPRLAAPSS